MSNTRLGEEVAVGLLAGPADFARLREARRQSPLMARLLERLEENLLKGNYPDHSFLPVAQYAFLSALDARKDLADRAITEALETVHKPHWIHHEAGCIGLMGMHYTQELCLAIDWLWPVLNRDQREALLGGVIAKSVENLSHTPPGVRDETDGNGQLLLARRLDVQDRFCLHPQPTSVNNWDIWFASSIYLAAALAERAWLHPDPAWPQLEWGHYYQVGYTLDAARVERWKALARERLTTALANQVGENGGYGEGPSYTSYGGMAITIGLSALERLEGLSLWSPGLLALPRWLRNQFVADLPFGVANFNDTAFSVKPGAPLLAHLAARSRDPEAQGFVLEALEQGWDALHPLTILGLATDLPAQPMTLPPATCYQPSGQVIWRTAQDRSGVFFATQSGAHGGAHQHKDRASFFLSAYGEHLLVDSGDGRYGEHLPNAPRFDATRAHNCVLIDGRGQIGDNANPVTGRVLEHRHEGNLSTALLDASDCHEGITSYHRRIVFLRPDLFIIADRVDGKCENLTWVAQGYNRDGLATWESLDRSAVLTRPQARLHCIFLEPLAGIRLATGMLDNIQQALLRFEADVPGHAVTAVLVPLRDGEPAPDIIRDESGALTLRLHDNVYTITTSESHLTVNEQKFSLCQE